MANEVAVIPLNEIERIGTIIAKSNLFGVKTPEQAIALCMIAHAEGLHPAQAAMEYDIIQGRPARKAEAMLARFQKSGGMVKWVELNDTKASAEFSHPQSPTPILIEWDMKRAEQAGLKAKENWRKWPRQMLRARVISEGVRSTYPACTNGLYTPEEVIEFEPVKEPKDVTPKKAIKEESDEIFWENELNITVDGLHTAKTQEELKNRFMAAKDRFKDKPKFLEAVVKAKDTRKAYFGTSEYQKEVAEFLKEELNDEIPDFGSPEYAVEKQAVEVNTPSVVVATAPSPATVALKHFRDGKPKWEYWVSEAIDALNKCDDVGAWLTAHDNLLTALEIADKGLYEKVNAVAIERMG